MEKITYRSCVQYSNEHEHEHEHDGTGRSTEEIDGLYAVSILFVQSPFLLILRMVHRGEFSTSHQSIFSSTI